MSQQIAQQACSHTLNGVYARERAAAQQATQAATCQTGVPSRDLAWASGYQSQPPYQPARNGSQNVAIQKDGTWWKPYETQLQEIGRLILDLNDHDMHRLSRALDIPPVSVDSAGWKLIGDK